MAVDEKIAGFDIPMDLFLLLQVDQSPQYLEGHTRQRALGNSPHLQRVFDGVE